MAATVSETTPGRNGRDAGRMPESMLGATPSDEVQRLRAAVQTLADMVIGHGIMDARTLQALLGDLVEPVLKPVAMPAPAPTPKAVVLPPPALAADDVATTISRSPLAHPQTPPAPAAVRPAPPTPPVAARPAALPAPAPAARSAPLPAPAPAAAPVAARPAPLPAPAPAARPASLVVPLEAPAPVARPASLAAPLEAPAPRPARPVSLAAPVEAPAPRPARPVSLAAPLEAPAPAADAHAAKARRNPFATSDAPTVAAVLDEPTPTLKSPGLFARLFGGKRSAASPAAMAKNASSIEFTERMPKLPFGDKDGLYSEQQRATELSFPPDSVQRKPRAAAAPRKPTAQDADAAPKRVCDRCWRRMDADGVCKSCT